MTTKNHAYLSRRSPSPFASIALNTILPQCGASLTRTDTKGWGIRPDYLFDSASRYN